MERLDLTFVDFITSRLTEAYIANADPQALLIRHNYQIPLNEYLCCCYGLKNNTLNERTIEWFYIKGKHGLKKKCAFFIDYYDQEINSYKEFWVNDGESLRRNIFGFQEKTQLFRVTFLIDPISREIYRLYNIQDYLCLPILSVMYQKIYDNVEEFYIGKDDEDCKHLLNTSYACVSFNRKQKTIQHLLKKIEILEMSIVSTLSTIIEPLQEYHGNELFIADSG